MLKRIANSTQNKIKRFKKALKRLNKNRKKSKGVFAFFPSPSNKLYWECRLGGRYDLKKVRPKGATHPIYLRKGTSDILNYRAIFERKEYDFLKADLENMLDLGGYIGLASVFVANKFPGAQILLVEPDPDNFLMAQLNCRGYKNIKCVNSGVWSHSCRLVPAGQNGDMGGDYGKMFVESCSHELTNGLPALSVKDLMELEKWKSIAFCKIDIEGSEKTLFDAPDAEDWIKNCSIISCEFHDRFVAGCTESAEKIFKKLSFAANAHGEYTYFRNTVYDQA